MVYENPMKNETMAITFQEMDAIKDVWLKLVTTELEVLLLILENAIPALEEMAK